MKGDILVIEDHHRQAAIECYALIRSEIEEYEGTFAISIAGESGAGKSEVAESLAQELIKAGYPTYVFQQDDYFVYPPLSNARRREEDISRVGTAEVNLDELDKELGQIKGGEKKITKPLVIFREDKITSEEVDLSGYKIILAEGTYTTLLDNIDCRIFITRNKEDTREARLKRNREKQDEYLEKILTIEHEIISKHKPLADILITKDFHAVKQENYEA